MFVLALRMVMAYIEHVPDQFKWQGRAACKNVPSYVFFPDEKSLPGFIEDSAFRGKRAQDYCETCPVKRICEEFSVLHDMEGIWGNNDDKWRRKRFPKEERFEMRNGAEELERYYPLYGHS